MSIPEWLETVQRGIESASHAGDDTGRLTEGEKALLDYLWIKIRHRNGVARKGTSDEVVTAVWQSAVQKVEAEIRQGGA